MARPFRYKAPEGGDDLLRRDRLLRRLDLRWERRLVTIVAGPGFGKTSLLVSVLEREAERRASDDEHRDVWLSCEPADAAPGHLGRGLCAAAGLAPPTTSREAVDQLVQWVWSQAPTDVGFVLDDVHEIPHGSDGADLLAQLLTDLPLNGHLVLASRHPPPLSSGRVAAGGQLLRLGEEDLLFDVDERRMIAGPRGVDAAMLASTGGWPALVSLTISAGADLVPEYLWEELLSGLDDDRVALLARIALVGEVDDEMATHLADRSVAVNQVFSDLPLVERTEGGGAVLHPLWGPPLRQVLSREETLDTYRRAASAHRRAHRFNEAIDLLAEAQDWGELLEVMREAQLIQLSVHAPSIDFGRWYEMLPAGWRTRPEALLAAGVEVHRRAPADSIPLLSAAAAGFRERDDIDGESAAIAIHALVLWWSGDVTGILVLYQRVSELAERGSRLAVLFQALGLAAVAHLQGDSAGVFEALRQVAPEESGPWRPLVEWFRAAALRRDGELSRAIDALDALVDVPLAGMMTQIEVVRLRTEWLLGATDGHLERLAAARDEFARVGDHFNRYGAIVELGGRTAWLGDDVAGAAILAEAPTLDDSTGAMVRTTQLIAEAAVAVGRGDEAAAAALLSADVLKTLGTAEGWYWHDRAAVALVYVLVPESRALWDAADLAPAHAVGRTLGSALIDARLGDLTAARGLEWPSAGVVRAHLPLRWIIELIAVGAAADNPAPAELVEAVATHLPPRLQDLAAEPATDPTVRSAAATLFGALPTRPPFDLGINVLGPVQLTHDESPASSPHLRRARVRELLCCLVARRRVHREQLVEEIWPDHDNGARNLRVTLSYLHQVLEPHRVDGSPPYFVRSDGPWLSLEPRDRLRIDVWDLEEQLAAAADAERTGSPADALEAYRQVLPLWRGDPYGDVRYADWAEVERVRLRDQYRAAAQRAGELLLASGAPAGAREAARGAISADPTHEAPYRLLARAYEVEGDGRGVEHAFEECRSALATVGLEPSSVWPVRAAGAS